MPISESLKSRTYIGEADFYFSILKPDFQAIKKGSTVVEIGSGTGLLSMYIASLGYKVYSFEPQSSGFMDMLKMKELVNECWEGNVPNVDSSMTTIQTRIFKRKNRLNISLQSM